MTQIVITEAPASVKPNDPTTYFPDNPDVKKREEARQKVPGKARWEIPAGTLIATLVEIKQDQDGHLFMRVADASCGADSFWLSNPTPEDEAVLGAYLGTMVAAVFVIRERIGDYSCHGSRYIVDPSLTLAALPCNPTAEQLGTMRLGAHFVVQGQFVRYYEVTPPTSAPDEYRKLDTLGYIVIRTPSGELTLDTCRPNMKEPYYDAGVLENLRGKRMMQGETIRITGFIMDKDPYGKRRLGTATVGYNYPYLLVPSPQRLAEYEALRVVAQARTERLRRYVVVQDWKMARRVFAGLRQLELTRDEADMIVEIMEGVPAEHRSVYYLRRVGGSKLERVFGLDPETLNREQFLVYAREILHGVRENAGIEEGRVDQTKLFGFWRAKHSILAPDDLVELLLSTIPIRLRRLEMCSDKRDDFWDDESLLRSCINRVNREHEDVDPRLVQAVVEVVERCFSEGYYRLSAESPRDQQCPQRLDDILQDCFSALADAWMCQPVVREFITPQVVAGWMTRLTEAGADMYIISRLRERVPRR